MKKVFILAIMVLLSTTQILQAQVKDKKGDADKKANKEIVKKAVVNQKVELKDGIPFNTVCPVSGEKLENDKITVSYNGKLYGLCCKKCVAKFTKDPEKYAAKLNNDGQGLKKK